MDTNPFSYIDEDKVVSREWWSYCKFTKNDVICDHLCEKLIKYSCENRAALLNIVWRGKSCVNLVIRRGLVNILSYFEKNCGVVLINKTTLPCNIKESPIHEAVNFNQTEIIKYLLKLGADVNSRLENGLTPLMLSSSVEVSELLINSGADVKILSGVQTSALHFAVRKGNLEMTKLLVDHGSELHEDLLMECCFWYQEPIFEYLLKFYRVQMQIEACEIFGMICLSEDNNYAGAFRWWKQSMRLRNLHRVTKTLGSEFIGIVEFVSLEELTFIRNNQFLMKINGFLICQRILGSSHEITIEFASELAWDPVTTPNDKMLLSKFALENKLQKTSILEAETCSLFQDFISILCKDVQTNYDKYEDIFGLLNQVLVQLKNTPVAPDDDYVEYIYNCVISNITDLFLFVISASKKDLGRVIVLLRDYKDILTRSRDSILHHAVSNVIRVDGYIVDFTLDERMKMVEFLLQTGFDANIKNFFGETPLLAALKAEFNDETLMSLLLDFGAHVDIPDGLGLRAIDIGFRSKIPLSLKCLCATKFSKVHVKYWTLLPKKLQSFVKMHLK